MPRSPRCRFVRRFIRPATRRIRRRATRPCHQRAEVRTCGIRLERTDPRSTKETFMKPIVAVSVTAMMLATLTASAQDALKQPAPPEAAAEAMGMQPGLGEI